MQKLSTLLYGVAVSVLVAATAPRTACAQFAVIVHPDAPVSNVSVDELRRYFLGKSTMLGATQLQVVEHPKERPAFYRALAGLSEDEVRRRWVGLAFRGEAPVLPKEIADAAEVRRFVSEHPGAIAFLDAAAVDGSVKVLSVGGHRPADPSYPLR